MRSPLLLQLLATGLATSASAPASYDPLRDDPDSMSVGCLDHSDCTVLGYRWGYLHTTHYLHTIYTLSVHTICTICTHLSRWGCLVYKCVDHGQVTGCDDTRPCPGDQEYECVK